MSRRLYFSNKQVCFCAFSSSLPTLPALARPLSSRRMALWNGMAYEHLLAVPSRGSAQLQKKSRASCTGGRRLSIAHQSKSGSVLDNSILECSPTPNPLRSLTANTSVQLRIWTITWLCVALAFSVEWTPTRSCCLPDLAAVLSSNLLAGLFWRRGNH